MSYVYFLIYPKLKAFKIGKAINVYERSIGISKWWGIPDYKSSFYIHVSDDLVLKLERSLHLFLSSYNLELADGDGKTEFFKIESLDDAKQCVDLFLKTNKVSGELIKGIDIPLNNSCIDVSKRKKMLSREYQNFNSLRNKSIKALDYNFENYKKILRVFSILVRFKHKINYNVKEVDGILSITFFEKKYLAMMLFEYFRFNYFCAGKVSGGGKLFY